MVVVKITLISVLLSVITFGLFGFLEMTQLIPLGLVAFYSSIAISYIFYLRKHYNVQLLQYFRAIPDTWHYIKNKI